MRHTPLYHQRNPNSRNVTGKLKLNHLKLTGKSHQRCYYLVKNHRTTQPQNIRRSDHNQTSKSHGAGIHRANRRKNKQITRENPPNSPNSPPPPSPNPPKPQPTDLNGEPQYPAGVAANETRRKREGEGETSPGCLPLSSRKRRSSLHASNRGSARRRKKKKKPQKNCSAKRRPPIYSEESPHPHPVWYIRPRGRTAEIVRGCVSSATIGRRWGWEPGGE